MLDNKNEKLNCFLVVYTNTYFTGFLPLARMLQQSSKYEPIFYFALHYPTVGRDISICRSEHIKYNCQFLDSATLIIEGDLEQAVQPIPIKQRIKRYLPQILERTIWRLLKGFDAIFIDNPICHYRVLVKQLRVMRSIIREEKLSLIVLPSDNRYTASTAINAAHLENIPAVVIPQFMASVDEWANFVMLNEDYNLKKLLNRVVAALYPRWAIEYKGRKLIALPGSHVLAQEWLGVAPPLPWILHSGFADAIAVESEAVLQYCLREGLPPEQLFLTGSMAHAVLEEGLADYQNLRAELYHQLDLPDRPMILSALPPDQLYGFGRQECDFQKYEDLVQFWVKSLAKVGGYNIVFCLHPSVTYDNMKYIEQWGVKIAQKSTAELIPLCDLYVASISATIQWAIACGKPVLNYDVYRYRYPDYLSVEGVITIEERDAFLSELQRLTTDDEYYQKTVLLQNKHANYWGRLDGQAGKRLRDLFDKLVQSYRCAPKSGIEQ